MRMAGADFGQQQPYFLPDRTTRLRSASVRTDRPQQTRYPIRQGGLFEPVPGMPASIAG